MKRVFIVIMIIGLFASCSNANGTKKFLMSQGYTDIETRGFDFWAHGKSDLTTTAFTATLPNGKRVRGAVSDKGPLTFGPRMNIRIWDTY